MNEVVAVRGQFEIEGTGTADQYFDIGLKKATTFDTLSEGDLNYKYLLLPLAAMSHETPVRVDHTGIAVDSIADAEPILFTLGCRKLIEESVEGRFRWAQYDFGMDASRLELIEPAADDTFLTEYLDEHGPGLHHITFEVADLAAVAAALEDAGYRIVEYTEYDDWTEAFIPPSNPTGALFQLFEYHEGYGENRPPADMLYVNSQQLDNS